MHNSAAWRGAIGRGQAWWFDIVRGYVDRVAVGNLSGLTDSVGNTTTWAYDGLNRVTTETNALVQARTFAYDAVGNLLSRTDRNGRVIEWDYDALYRATQERWIDEFQTVVETIDSTYDLADQLQSAADSKSAYAFAYDNLGRVTSEDNAGSVSPHVVQDQVWDLVGRRTELAADVGGTADLKNLYEYDLLGRMTRAQQTAQAGGAAVAEKRVDFLYDALGRFSTISRFADLGGTSLVADSEFSFDAGGNLDSLTHRQGQTNVLADYIWTHDDLHRVTSFWSQADGTANYSYDPASEVTGATYDYQSNESFSFDLNGNRSMIGYVTGPNNQLLSDGAFDYAYDSEGNRTLRTEIATGATTEYQWDHRNRLVKIVERDGSSQITKTVDYAYDVFDRRIQKSIAPAVGPAEVEQYIHDGVHMLLRFENGSLTNRYLHGPAVDQILADEQLDPVTGQTERLLWPLTDNLGTIRDLAEFDSGTGDTSVVNHLAYDAFGQVTSVSDPSVEHQFAYTGRDRDDESDLYYYRARYYEAATGRFVSEDPIGFAAGDGNLNRYVGNEVTNAVDPSGLQDGPAASMWIQVQIEAQKRPPRPLTEDERLLLELGQLGLDIAGIIEPTPFCDLTSAGISLGQGNVAEAGISVVAFVPWLGDLAKAGKLPKLATTISKVAARMSQNAEFARRALPLLRLVRNSITGILQNPDLIRCLGLSNDHLKQLRRIRAQLDDVIRNAGNAARKNVDELSKPSGDVLDRIQEAKRQFDTNEEFRNWAHKAIMEKMKLSGGGKTNPDMSPHEIAEIFEEWVSLGKPVR